MFKCKVSQNKIMLTILLLFCVLISFMIISLTWKKEYQSMREASLKFCCFCTSDKLKIT